MNKNFVLANLFIFLFASSLFLSVYATEVSFPVTNISTDQQTEMMAKYKKTKGTDLFFGNKDLVFTTIK